MAEFLLNENEKIQTSEIVDYYLMTGGVVRYLQQIKTNKIIQENQDLLFQNTYFDDFLIKNTAIPPSKL